jgi:dipeptidyl aminopeptidase/acylaminoacyl peptidase
MIAALACCSFAVAAESPRTHGITIDDVFSIAYLGALEISPDGKQIIYTDSRWEPPRERRNSDLWLVGTDGGTPRRLTFDFGSESSLTWSPDGKAIFYKASHQRNDGKYPPYNGEAQVWRLNLATGEETPVTRVEKGVESFALTHDGSSIFYSTKKDANTDEWKPLQEKFGDLKYGHGERGVTEIWKLDLASWRGMKVYDGDEYVHEFAIAPDASRVAMVVTKDDKLISLEGWSSVKVLDVASGKTTTLVDEQWRRLAPSPHGWIANPSWSPDGSKLAFNVSFDGYPTRVFVADFTTSAESPKIWSVDRPEDVEFAETPLKWAGDESLLFAGEWHARSRVYRVNGLAGGKQSKTDVVTPGDVAVDAFDVSDDGGTIAAVKADPTSLQNVFAITADEKQPYRQLTNVNPQTSDWKLPKLSIVEWTGSDGDKVEGVLELPADYKEGTKLPLILDIHGGPTAATSFSQRIGGSGGVFASKGYAVLRPNYHGSTGYGDEFMTKLIGRENDIEVGDLIKGVDAMIERGIAYPDRLAVMGWSNGGFLTNAVVTADQRFKAASSGAGVLDQFLQWGLEDTPGHVINYMKGKQPWQDAPTYDKASPAYKLDKVKTPMLIHVGENDARVPAAHARTLHRALYRYLDVPVQLVIYPGEGHGLEVLKHRRAKLEWDAAWFDHYVLGKEIGKEEE